MQFFPYDRIINRGYRLAPVGLLYEAVPYGSAEYSSTAIVDASRRLWETSKAKASTASQEERYVRESQDQRRFTVQGAILNHYSRMANDSGVMCIELELYEDAEAYFERALEFSDDNYCAMQNLIARLQSTGGDSERVSELETRSQVEWTHMADIVSSYISLLFPQLAMEDTQAARDQEKIITTQQLVIRYGYLTDSSFYRNYTVYAFPQSRPLLEAIYNRRLRSFTPYRSLMPYYDLEFKMLQLALAIDPANAELHADKAVFLSLQEPLMGKLQAVIEYETANDNGASKPRENLLHIATIYRGMQDRDTAEKYTQLARETASRFEDPVDRKLDDAVVDLRLVEHYIAFRYKLDEALALAKRVSEIAAEVAAGREGQTADQATAVFLRSTGNIFRIMLAQDRSDEIPQYVDDFAAKYPQWQDKIKGTLANLYRLQNKIEEAGRIYERIKLSVEDPTGLAALTLAKLYLQQKEYEKVIALEKGPDADEKVLAAFHLVRGEAYHQLEMYPKAVTELETALDLYRRAVEKGEDLEETSEYHFLNALAWLYYLSGWPDRGTAEGNRYLNDALQLSRSVYEETRRLGVRELQHRSFLLFWDTYAWVLYRLTDEDREARSIMQLAYVGNPTSPAISYHYGVMLYDEGRTTEGLALISEGYAGGLEDFEEEEAADILKQHNIELPEKRER
jgi:tetratricopeptide (TPR) repeat protein